jgi:hypothetical protein
MVLAVSDNGNKKNQHIHVADPLEVFVINMGLIAQRQ